MRKIIIGFSRPRGWFKPYAWAIRLFEGWTPYCHVYIKSYSQMADMWLVYQASGTQVNFMGQRFFDAKAVTVKEFPFDISEDAFKKYMVWSIENAGAPYDIKAVLGIAIMRVFRLRGNPFADGARAQYCAELAARALHDFLGKDIDLNEFETAGPKRLYDICEILSAKEDL